MYYTAIIDESNGTVKSRWKEIYDAAFDEEFTTMPANIHFDKNAKGTIDLNRIAKLIDGTYFGEIECPGRDEDSDEEELEVMDTYDIQVDCPTQSFIAANCVVHNSICKSEKKTFCFFFKNLKAQLNLFAELDVVKPQLCSMLPITHVRIISRSLLMVESAAVVTLSKR